MEIKSITYGSTCFGNLMRVNGVDYEDMSEQEQIDIIMLATKEDYGRSTLFMEALKILSSEYDGEYSTHYCSQCGTTENIMKVNLE